MGSIVHRSVPTNLKWLPNCSHAHALFQDRFKDVQVGSRWFSSTSSHQTFTRSHNWSAGHFSPSWFVLCCVFWFVLLVCFCSLVLFCFSVCFVTEL